MGDPLKWRVVDAFTVELPDERGEIVKPKAYEYGDQYLDHVVDNIGNAAESTRKAAGYVVAFAIAFFLLAGAQTSAFSLGPLKLTGVAAVLTLVPALVSFFYYEYVANAYTRLLYERLKDVLVAELYPTIGRAHLQQFLSPPTLQAWGTDPAHVLPDTVGPRTLRLLKWNANLIVIGFAAGVLVFLVWAYIWLIGDKQTNAVAITASVAFSVANLARAALTTKTVTAIQTLAEEERAAPPDHRAPLQ